MEDSLVERDINKLQSRYQAAVQKALADIDERFLRKMQLQFFKCGARCCENPDMSSLEVQRCIERCESPLGQAQSFMQSEISSFQTRVQQCATECMNVARDKLKPDASDTQLKNAQKEAFECSQNCVDAQLSTGLPALTNRLQTHLQKMRNDQQLS